MTLWLIAPEARELVDLALSSNWQPTASQEAEIQARSDLLSSGAPPRIYSTAGTTAEINIEGPLTKRPDILAMIFGGGNVSYAEIISALQLAEQDPNVTDIQVYMDSPGGMVSGLFETLAQIEATSKPIQVLAANANSAAYAIASAMGPITASTPASSFGSIGVYAEFRVHTGLITMRSTQAPSKNPDPSTDEGQAELQSYMDGMHDIFVEAIANGRGTSPETVNKNFGRGASLLAAQAKAQGLIDSISTPELKAVGTQTQTFSAQTEHVMDLKTLKAQHPDLFAEVMKLGSEQEQERVFAHLDMADSTGARKVAIEAIRAGTRIDHQPTLAKYFAEGRNQQDQADRAADDQAVIEATAEADAPSDDASNLDELVASKVLEDLHLG